MIVIGGGLAGITAALDCAQVGAEVTLLESRGRLGGAAYSFRRDGLWADNGQHVFLRCCTEYQRLVHELDADALVTIQPRLDIAVLAPGGRLLLSTPAHGRLAIALRGVEAYSDPVGDHLHLYTRRSLLGLLDDFDFSELEVHSAGGPPGMRRMLLARAVR